MTEQDPRRGKITAENIAEGKRLKALWEEKKAELKDRGYGTQEAFGDKFGIGNQSAVGFFLNGKTALSMKAALGFARGLECKVSDFSPRLAAQLDGPTFTASEPWPFPDIDPRRFARLSPTQRIEIQGVVRERLESFERAGNGGSQDMPGQPSGKRAAHAK